MLRSYFEAGFLVEINDIINDELLSDRNYFKSVNYLSDLKFKLRVEARMTNPIFMRHNQGGELRTSSSLALAKRLQRRYTKKEVLYDWA